MSLASDKVVALRRLLHERHGASRPRVVRTISTGVPAVDDMLDGGLRTGAITEFVSESASSGCQTAFGALLMTTRLARQRIALVDASGRFAIDGLEEDAFAHLVWIRCRDLAACWRAADLVARDPNYSITVIDVRGRSTRDLLRTRDSVWVRLQRAAEHAKTAVVVQSDDAVVPNAACRVIFDRPLEASVLTAPRRSIVSALAPSLQRRRLRALEGTA